MQMLLRDWAVYSDFSLVIFQVDKSQFKSELITCEL